MKPKNLGAAILASLAAMSGAAASMTLPPYLRDGHRIYLTPADAWGGSR